MGLKIGDTAPNFQADTTEGKIDFHEWLGDSWGILYSHPADFTPVCTTEIGRTAQLKDEFAKRNTKVAVVSVDDVKSHNEWKKDVNETQNTSVEFPIIGDEDKKVANLYDMIHENASETATVRSVFFIGPDKKIKATIVYPASTGRNFAEILRVIDSLQLSAKHPVATPADWVPGNDVIIGLGVKDEEIEAKFPKGHKIIKPYLRTTPQPE
ncbi:peroxiredoxin [Marivirga tractuosa]|uniref:peroxiredoxin n=1 Tax=Marivirga tractuosa TaxID=1006 RepID=UPI0035D0AC9D